MATEIRMPRLGHSMTEGTLVAWLAEPGATIHAGQILLTIETDKAEYEVEAPADGVLSEPLVAETRTVPVGAVLGWVLAPGETRPDTPAANAPPAESAPRGRRQAPAGRVRASPKARRRADERGIDLAAVTGSGPDGLVTEADVERAARAAQPASEPATGEWNGRPVRERRRLTPVRRTTARRMVDAWTHVPHIVQMIDVDMAEVRRLRGRWKTEGGDAATIGYNDFIVKATALALAEHPEINAAVDGDELLVFAEVNAGIAVETARGLLVPVVRCADRHSLLAVSREAHRLAEKARGGGLDPGDCAAGTFTVSNLGGFGIRAGTPVLNPPEAVLVFVGAVEERPVVRDGTILARPTVTLSIAYDHRVADGADAARLSERIARLLESPASWAEPGHTDGAGASKRRP
jgi:pyruvate dehydrogenase E2 component (dihydrolipoyllysine-residue acetyltransferase)